MTEIRSESNFFGTKCVQKEILLHIKYVHLNVIFSHTNDIINNKYVHYITNILLILMHIVKLTLLNRSEILITDRR